MHVPARDEMWEGKNHQGTSCTSCPLHKGPWLFIMSFIILPRNHKAGENISKLREVGSRGSKTTGTGLSRWWRLSQGLQNVPSTLSLPPPAPTSQPAGPPQGLSFITTQCCDSGIFLMGSLFVGFFFFLIIQIGRNIGPLWVSPQNLAGISGCPSPWKRRLWV